MPYFIEHTDTFGGEANYSWVDRYNFDGTEKQAIKAAKAAVGWTGVRCTREYLSGYGWAYRKPGVCQVLFITWCDTFEHHYHSGKRIDRNGQAME